MAVPRGPPTGGARGMELGHPGYLAVAPRTVRGGRSGPDRARDDRGCRLSSGGGPQAGPVGPGQPVRTFRTGARGVDPRTIRRPGRGGGKPPHSDGDPTGHPIGRWGHAGSGLAAIQDGAPLVTGLADGGTEHDRAFGHPCGRGGQGSSTMGRPNRGTTGWAMVMDGRPGRRNGMEGVERKVGRGVLQGRMDLAGHAAQDLVTAMGGASAVGEDASGTPGHGRRRFGLGGGNHRQGSGTGSGRGSGLPWSLAGVGPVLAPLERISADVGSSEDIRPCGAGRTPMGLAQPVAGR